METVREFNKTFKQKVPKDDGEIYTEVDENAMFPGGEQACFQYIADNVRYPQEARMQGIQGRAIVGFVVNTDGTISDIEVVGSPHKLLSEEAVRLIKAMPKWKPALKDGRVVRSRFNLPVMFKLN